MQGKLMGTAERGDIYGLELGTGNTSHLATRDRRLHRSNTVDTPQPPDCFLTAMA